MESDDEDLLPGIAYGTSDEDVSAEEGESDEEHSEEGVPQGIPLQSRGRAAPEVHSRVMRVAGIIAFAAFAMRAAAHARIWNMSAVRRLQAAKAQRRQEKLVQNHAAEQEDDEDDEEEERGTRSLTRRMQRWTRTSWVKNSA